MRSIHIKKKINFYDWHVCDRILKRVTKSEKLQKRYMWTQEIVHAHKRRDLATVYKLSRFLAGGVGHLSYAILAAQYYKEDIFEIQKSEWQKLVDEYQEKGLVQILRPP